MSQSNGPFVTTPLDFILFLKRGLWRGQQTPALLCKTGSVHGVSAPLQDAEQKPDRRNRPAMVMAGVPAGRREVSSG